MAKINYHGRKFRGISNTPNGQVSGDTVFSYQQHGKVLTATYAGGSILQGQIMGIVSENNQLNFAYHHIDLEGKLKSGYCQSIPEILNDGRIRLQENWEWTVGGEGKGESIVEEMASGEW